MFNTFYTLDRQLLALLICIVYFNNDWLQKKTHAPSAQSSTYKKTLVYKQSLMVKIITLFNRFHEGKSVSIVSHFIMDGIKRIV